MSTTASGRFTTLPSEQTLSETTVALEEHGFGVEVVDDLGSARYAVLSRIPEGASVMTNTSVTLEETTLETARERISEHSLKLEDARALAAYGQNSSIGKVLEIHQELPGRIHVVLVRQVVGF